MNTQQLIKKLTGGKPNTVCPHVIEVGRCNLSRYRTLLYELSVGAVGVDSETVYGVSIFCIWRSSGEEALHWRKLSRMFNSIQAARQYLEALPHIIFKYGEAAAQFILNGSDNDPSFFEQLKNPASAQRYHQAKKWKTQEVHNG